MIWSDDYERKMHHHTVRKHRWKNEVQIWVGDGYGYSKWSRTTKLAGRWWYFASPGERIRDHMIKAQKVADKLNHREMYMAHELEIGVRDEQ